MENTTQQVPEQPQQATQEEQKKGMNPFLKGVLTTLAAGTTIYLGYKYRHELKRGAKKVGRKVSGLFSGKATEPKEEQLSMIIIETPREERRREHRPNPNPNPQPQQNNWNKGGQNNVKR